MRLVTIFLLGSLCTFTAQGVQPLINPCLKDPYKSMPFCNYSLGLDERSADAVSRLTKAEKIDALGTATDELKSLGLNAYNWWSEATHGISHVSYDSETPYASNVALPITTSCSFNRSLWWATGSQIGREARAFMNAGNAGSTYWAPVINIVREPRWGRNIETPGEDPFLTGQYAINFVKGMEKSEADPGHIQASACCKHFVANELESWNGSTRHTFNAVVSAQDLQDSYLPPFQDCVEKGRVSGIMCSYNEVNGIPSCANDWLLKTVLREAWEFDGYVTSDCDADGDVYDSHHYTATPEEAVRDVLRAGTDVDCTSFVPKNAQSALDKGLINWEDIDTVLKRLFRVRMRLGHFDPPGPLQAIGPDAVCTPEAIELGRQGAIQGTVLLKNDGTLPLSAAKVNKAAVIGPNANLSKAIATYYGGTPCFNAYWNAVDAVQQYISDTTVEQGLPSVTSTDTSGFDAAVKAAQSADIVVLVIGQDGTIEHEGHDRTTIAIQDGQLQLIDKITSSIDNKPIIALILTAGAIDVTPLLNNPKINAILDAGQPSVTVLGVGDLIFGKESPAGRMVQTTYPAAFVNNVSMFDMGMRPGPSVWPPFTNPGRTYRFYTGQPVLPFGFGLSYSTFTYKVIGGPDSVSLTETARKLALPEGKERNAHLQTEAVGYYVNVTNTGKVDAADAVLGFMVPPGAGENGTPLKQLFGFERIFLKAGGTITVYLGAQYSVFTQVDIDGQRLPWIGQYRVEFGVPETSAQGMGFTTYSHSVTL